MARRSRRHKLAWTGGAPARGAAPSKVGRPSVHPSIHPCIHASIHASVQPSSHTPPPECGALVLRGPGPAPRARACAPGCALERPPWGALAAAR
eukprot:scaffold2229_cov413-Prasinococcus_capsulatus_cf.AAC.1